MCMYNIIIHNDIHLHIVLRTCYVLHVLKITLNTTLGRCKGERCASHCTLAVVSAASQAVGGFKEGATAYRHCRQCLGTATQTREKVRY